MSCSRLSALLAVLIAGPDLLAGTIEVAVNDRTGAPVSDAVVFAKSASSQVVPARKQTVIDQRDKQFAPYVTAVQVGTAVLFPNSDNIRHHVYSFSQAKKFELPLYSGVPAAPVIFDKVGFVTLGCNIHDWMVAYVAVMPTPYFQVTTNDGHAVLKGVPAGAYTVEVWQPCLKGSPEALAQRINVEGNSTTNLEFKLDLKPDFRARRAPGLSSGGYR